MTRSIIGAAEHCGATVIFPGNNYNFGKIDQPITEITPFNPSAPLGKVHMDLEKMLQQATDQGRIRTLVVRMAEIWGPNVTNKQFAPVFENALKGKAMPWLIAADTPQQLLYAPDAARAIVAVAQRDFHQTSMRDAIAEKLEWFKQNGSGSDARRKAKRRARVDGTVRVTVDNIAIAAFR